MVDATLRRWTRHYWKEGLLTHMLCYTHYNCMTHQIRTQLFIIEKEVQKTKFISYGNNIVSTDYFQHKSGESSIKPVDHISLMEII